MSPIYLGHPIFTPTCSPTESQVSLEARVIIIMGPSGTGKSTFIDTATRQDGHTVGHNPRPHTSDIRAVRVQHPTTHSPVVFVDTPAFDDIHKSDTEILSMISDWLVTSYKGHVNLATIVYLHRISDNRMSGSVLKNLRMFTSLCGEQAMPNVILATTMWSKVDTKEGMDR